jgi:hypothetical protein
MEPFYIGKEVYFMDCGHKIFGYITGYGQHGTWTGISVLCINNYMGELFEMYPIEAYISLSLLHSV